MLNLFRSFSHLGLLLAISILISFQIQPASAWFRVACTTPLVQERIDPINSAGKAPSNHVHTVHGASDFSSNSTYDTLRSSNCTSCEVAQDLSNYWFPKLYFQDPSTNMFEAVPNGGLLVYYQNRGSSDVANGGSGLRAFPPGLRMVSGDPRRRVRRYTPGEGSQAELAERAIEWECLRYTAGLPGYNSAGAGGSGQLGGFPNTDCEGGFNARIHMPACWDGVNLDSPTHTTHIAFLSDLDNGSCPPTHPVGMMKLLYEVTWDVHSFNTRWDPAKNKWPFVYSTGDPTGFSWHGDFQNGWNTTALQNAIDKCNNPNDPTGSGMTESCPFLSVTPAAAANQCKIPPEAGVSGEKVDGVLSALPGCNPIQPGPQNATIYSDSNCVDKRVTTSGAASRGAIVLVDWWWGVLGLTLLGTAQSQWYWGV